MAGESYETQNAHQQMTRKLRQLAQGHSRKRGALCLQRLRSLAHDSRPRAARPLRALLTLPGEPFPHSACEHFIFPDSAYRSPLPAQQNSSLLPSCRPAPIPGFLRALMALTDHASDFSTRLKTLEGQGLVPLPLYPQHPAQGLVPM